MKPKFLIPIERAAAFAAFAIAGLSPASAQLSGQFGILDLTANGGINPNTGNPWQEGDQYRLAFHTAETIDAQSDDPAVYDAFATSQAQQNPALADSSGWTAMVWVNTDSSLPQAQDLNNIVAGESPVSSPLVRSGTEDLTGGAGIGGAGVPVYATDGTTCIARNNADIYNNWSNPFDADTTLRLPSGSTNLDSDGNEVIADQNVNYSPYLDQFGLGDSATVHGKNVWTGGLGSAVNPLGNSVDPDGETRASWGSSNANTGGRTWNRFQGGTTGTQPVYAISELLTVGTGSPSAPFILSITAAVDPGTGFDLEWPSKDGKLYRIRSSAALDTAPTTWTVVSEDLASAGETTTLTVTPDETKLFYVVEEYEAP